jgi:hypothetical protein
MDRTVLIRQDVKAAISSVPIDFQNDFSKKFSEILTDDTYFPGLLNRIQDKINLDHALRLSKTFKWGKIEPDPATGATFAETYWAKSIMELVLFLDQLFSAPDYDASVGA